MEQKRRLSVCQYDVCIKNNADIYLVGNRCSKAERLEARACYISTVRN